jgi:hypothetical protein
MESVFINVVIRIGNPFDLAVVDGLYIVLAVVLKCLVGLDTVIVAD